MHRKSLFDRLETMNTVKEIEARRESVDASLRTVSLFPSVLQYADEAMIRRAEEERLASSAKEAMKKKAAATEVVKPKEEDHQRMVSADDTHKPASSSPLLTLSYFSVLFLCHGCWAHSFLVIQR